MKNTPFRVIKPQGLGSFLAVFFLFRRRAAQLSLFSRIRIIFSLASLRQLCSAPIYPRGPRVLPPPPAYTTSSRSSMLGACRIARPRALLLRCGPSVGRPAGCHARYLADAAGATAAAAPADEAEATAEPEEILIYQGGRARPLRILKTASFINCVASCTGGPLIVTADIAMPFAARLGMATTMAFFGLSTTGTPSSPNRPHSEPNGVLPLAHRLLAELAAYCVAPAVLVHRLPGVGIQAVPAEDVGAARSGRVRSALALSATQTPPPNYT